MPDEFDSFTAQLDAILDRYRASASLFDEARTPSRAEAETKVSEFRERVRANPADWNAFKMLAIALDLCDKRNEARAAMLKAYRLRHDYD